MNNCEMYQELMSRLVDGELSREEYARLDAHMENCAECSAMYAVFASLSEIIGSEDEALPEDLHENIMAGVRRSAMINHNRRRLSKPMRNTLAAAACAALVLFASRGLAPEKAADAVLTAQQVEVMDVQVQQPAKSQSEASVQAQPEPSPAVSAAPAAPVATAMPVASPEVTRDIYLETQEAKSAATNQNYQSYSQSYAVPTPAPVEIIVDTPATVNTPGPIVSPNSVVAQPVVTRLPAPTQEPELAVAAEIPAEAAAAPAAMAEEAQSENQPAMAAAEGGVALAAAEPVETESPSLTKKIFNFFGMARPEAESEAPAETEEAAAPVESAAAQPEMAMAPAAAEPEKAAEEKNVMFVKLDSLDKIFDLETLLEGEETQLPEEKADMEIHFELKEPVKDLEDYEVIVYIHGEKIYYVQIMSKDISVNCLAQCSFEDFKKFMDSLSDEEKGIQPSPSPVVSAAPSPEVSAVPAVEPAPAQPVQSPAAPVAAPQEAVE